MPSVLAANPMREVPVGLPILSCARYSIKTVSLRTAIAGLNTFLASQPVLLLVTGSVKVLLPGCMIGFTLSILTKGSSAQPVVSFVADDIESVPEFAVPFDEDWQAYKQMMIAVIARKNNCF